MIVRTDINFCRSLPDYMPKIPLKQMAVNVMTIFSECHHWSVFQFRLNPNNRKPHSCLFYCFFIIILLSVFRLSKWTLPNITACAFVM